MKNNLLKLGFTLAVSAIPLSSFAAQKAILIGIDGVQYEKMQALDTPNFHRLTIKKTYTGGIAGDYSEQGTSSGPGWSTILTGVWANKHQVISNGSGHASEDFPSIFRRIITAKPNLTQASLVNWSPIHSQFFSNDVDDIAVAKKGLSDTSVTSSTIAEINNGRDFIFAHLDDPDHVGHSDGFSKKYNDSIITADGQLGQILDSVEAAQQDTGDDWLVIVTTDHGREGTTGYSHGAQTASEKTVFIATNKPLNKEFSSTAAGENQGFSGLYNYTAQTSITPTILTHLGIKIENKWKLDGPSLLGDIGVRKLTPGAQHTLSWVSDSSKEANIYRNNQFAGSVAANQQYWQDDTSGDSSGIIDYVVELNNNPTAYRAYSLDINAALNWNTTRAYFFRSDNQYIRYNKTDDKADDNYPRVTTNSNWPGLGDYREKIVASFHKDANTAYFFLNNGDYIAYDINSDKALSGYPKAVDANTWPGLEDYADNIIATLRGNGDDVYFFLDNARYIRYNLKNDHADEGYPQAVNDTTWPGLASHAENITSALRWSDSRAYIFLTGQRYIRYNVSQNRADSGYPATTNNSTWPGMMNP
ncbi:type I phosphodiesterase/nucleotide pyrophosphatase [Sinobacterium caligoides]|uniref:Type I phosphodiesterase/nucleotide pyrophosphatase n=1 Tax=Sinobacterium caligoides TaxID=933926 RepID=A0A3N2DPQ8_9GAMM|nr:alkaline phosphatase family protein [Sinobacterium caligoides]ROS01804.1 type I phosphodiesterase/nucleotide pyrophosphatase [Sinobacterium caligoides]